MKVFYTHRALRQLENLSGLVQIRILRKIKFYADQKNPLEFAERLVDDREGQYRFRVGGYRVVFDLLRGSIYVLRVGRRDKVYD